MKAMMSERLRDILNDPASARELQKQLTASATSSPSDKRKTPKTFIGHFLGKSNNDHPSKRK